MSRHVATQAAQANPASVSNGVLQRKTCACGRPITANGECADCRKKRLALQRRAINKSDTAVAPPIVHDVLHSPGQPLDSAVRAFMEPRFGHDFSRVRVHTDVRAAASAQSVNALAYTVGQNIVFNTGQYTPHSHQGRQLLAHELAHTLQQSGSMQRKTDSLAVGPSHDPAEREAEAAAQAVFSNQVPRVTAVSQPILARRRDSGAETRSRTDTFTTEDGTTITRTIVPGVCNRRPESRRTSRSDIGEREAFFEIDTCRGRSGETLRGSLDYSDVIQRFGDLINRLPSERDPARAIRDFEDALRRSTPQAQIRYTWQFSQVQIQTTASAGANISGERTIAVSGLLRYSNGQFTIHLEAGHNAEFENSTRQSQNTTLTLNTDIGPVQIRFTGGLRQQAGSGGDTQTLSGTGTIIFPLPGGLGIGVQGSGERTTPPSGSPSQSATFQIVFGTFPRLEQERGRDCFVCACDDPRITYRCERPGDPSRTPPPAPPRITRYFPLFFEYADITPRADWQQRYDDTLNEITTWLEQGYTIQRIEGRTSPEGPLRPQQGGRFEGNISLARRRAEEARDDLRQRIRERAGSLLIMRRERLTPGQRVLQDVLTQTVPIVGQAPGGGPESAELFGSEAGTEQEMFRHLSQALQPPAPGQPDVLSQEHVLGEGLPATTLQESQTAVEAFRTGQAGRRALNRRQRLEAIYRVLRRALIVLVPPRIRLEDIRITQEDVDRMDAETRCTPAQQARIDAEIPKRGEWLFEVRCDEEGR